MDSIHSVLSRVLRKRGLEREAVASQAVYAAEQALQQILPRVAALLKPTKCAQGTLVIVAEHSIAAQECQAAIPQILAALDESLGSKIVTDIRLVRA